MEHSAALEQKLLAHKRASSVDSDAYAPDSSAGREGSRGAAAGGGLIGVGRASVEGREDGAGGGGSWNGGAAGKGAVGVPSGAGSGSFLGGASGLQRGGSKGQLDEQVREREGKVERGGQNEGA